MCAILWRFGCNSTNPMLFVCMHQDTSTIFFSERTTEKWLQTLVPEMLRENARTRRAPWKAKLSCCAVGFGWSTTLSRVVWFAQCTRCSALQCVSLCILSALLFMCKLDHSYFWHTVAKNDQGSDWGTQSWLFSLTQRLGRILLFPHCSSMAMSFPNDIKLFISQ